MDPSSREFVKHVRSHLHEHGFRLVMGRGKSLNCGMGRCSGYCDSESKEIRVAKGHPDMIATLLHEYCHFLQYLELPKRRNDAADNANLMVVEWLEGKEFPQNRLNWAFRIVRWFERDCERRSVSLISKFNLKICPVLYTQKANLYLYFWHMVERRRKWNWTNKRLFTNPSLVRVMPTDFRVKADTVIPPHIVELLEQF